jgi:hypothetical protein
MPLLLAITMRMKGSLVVAWPRYLKVELNNCAHDDTVSQLSAFFRVTRREAPRSVDLARLGFFLSTTRSLSECFYASHRAFIFNDDVHT